MLWFKKRSGQAMIEYILITIIILLAILFGTPQLKDAVGKIFTSSKKQVEKASTVWDAKM